MINEDKIPDSKKLENRLQHPAFPQPSDPNIKIWRYMDLAKLIWLLVKKKLYFTRLDKLPDQYEGSITSNTAKGIKLFLKQISADKSWEHILQSYLRAKTTMFVNCCYASNYESEAMWQLYCGPTQGVAIQTSYTTLVDSIKEEYETYIGLVSYIDYEKVGFPDSNLYYPIMHKRIAFAHENEVRLVKEYQGSDYNNIPNGVTIKWDPVNRIQAIYIHPYAPRYYFESVRIILEKISSKFVQKLKWSQIKSIPYLLATQDNGSPNIIN